MRMSLACILLSTGMAAMAADNEGKLLPEGAGKNTVARLCINCHGAGNFRKARQSRDEWWTTVGDMVDRGAKGTDAELEAVVTYLAENFGTDSKVNVNSAPMEELKAVLGIPPAQAQAVVAYREANGNFTKWQDLQKVPGIDARKIEEKKERMAF